MGMARLGLYARGGESRKQINAQKGRSTIETALPPISAGAVGKAWDGVLLGCRDSRHEGSLDIFRVPFCGCIENCPTGGGSLAIRPAAEPEVHHADDCIRLSAFHAHQVDPEVRMSLRERFPLSSEVKGSREHGSSRRSPLTWLVRSSVA